MTYSLEYLELLSYGNNIKTDDECLLHYEGDVTMISHRLQGAEDGKSIICIEYHNADVFILLIY